MKWYLNYALEKVKEFTLQIYGARVLQVEGNSHISFQAEEKVRNKK